MTGEPVRVSDPDPTCPFCRGTGDVYCTRKKCHEGCPIPEQRGHDKSWGGYYRVDCVCRSVPPRGKPRPVEVKPVVARGEGEAIRALASRVSALAEMAVAESVRVDEGLVDLASASYAWVEFTRAVERWEAGLVLLGTDRVDVEALIERSRT